AMVGAPVTECVPSGRRSGGRIRKAGGASLLQGEADEFAAPLSRRPVAHVPSPWRAGSLIGAPDSKLSSRSRELLGERRPMTREHNWADNHTFSAGRIHRPAAI